MNYISKIINVMQQDGIFALFCKIGRKIKLLTLPYFDYWFDLKHGIDTCRVVYHRDALDIGPDEKNTAVRYQATPVKAVRSILKKLPIDHSEFTFIDYGSGKGRVLLLAAEYPFKKIIGVELSKKLHEIAAHQYQNLEMF